jgi:hypothetical protein
MELFNDNGITTPAGIVAFTPEEAEAAYKSLGNRKFSIFIHWKGISSGQSFSERDICFR